jgi:hypothetical protein
VLEAIMYSISFRGSEEHTKEWKKTSTSEWNGTEHGLQKGMEHPLQSRRTRGFRGSEERGGEEHTREWDIC